MLFVSGNLARGKLAADLVLVQLFVLHVAVKFEQDFLRDIQP
jgi:hypothetical protein